MRRKADIGIGKRAAEEMLRINVPVRTQLRDMQLNHNCFYNWQNGACPDSRALQALCNYGFDVVYILTGRRTNADKMLNAIEGVLE